MSHRLPRSPHVLAVNPINVVDLATQLLNQYSTRFSPVQTRPLAVVSFGLGPPEDLFLRFAAREFVDQEIQVADILHCLFFDFLHAYATNLALDQ